MKQFLLLEMVEIDTTNKNRSHLIKVKQVQQIYLKNTLKIGGIRYNYNVSLILWIQVYIKIRTLKI